MALDPLPGVRCLRGTESREAAPLDWPRYLLVPPLRSAGGRRAYALLPPYDGIGAHFFLLLLLLIAGAPR